ncbi:MAG: competence protein ComEC [Myxococcota bacterium]|jgi:competence protein ComEC
MRRPLAWGGLMMWLGVLAGQACPVPADALIVGVWFMGALALAGRRWRAAMLAWPVGAFLAGAAVMATQPPTPELPDSAVVQGVAVSTSGLTVTARTDAGTLRLQFSGEAPSVGDQFAAWTQPGRPYPQLPGSFVSPTADRKVRRWVPLNAAPPDPRLDRFDLVEHGGLLRALATGQRDGVDEDTADLLRRTGTAHLLAISGLHIGLVAGMGWGLGWLLSRPLVFLRTPWPARIAPAVCALSVACAYGGLVGWPVSARRAAVMVGLACAGRLLARKVEPWSLLGGAAVVVLMLAPEQAVQPGALMSFGAVAGILWWSPAITRLIPPDTPRWLSRIATSLGASLGATLGTLPVTAWIFQQLSPLTPLTNLFASPLLAGVAVPGALLAARLPEPPALLALAFADAAAQLGISILTALDVTPFAPAVGLSGALALTALLPLRRHPAAAALLAVLALCVRPVPVGRLVVTFLSIGQGDAALIEHADGRRWLVDGGPPSTRTLRYLRRRGIRSLDAIFLSHPHPDHSGGLHAVMEGIEVGEFWTPRPPEHDETDYRRLWLSVFTAGATVRYPGDPGADILHPLLDWSPRKHRRRVNEQSLVLSVTQGDHRFLFTGDIEEEAEAELAGRIGEATVIKVAHHGSASSSSSDLIAAVDPDWAVISCGLDNHFRHPRDEVLGRWHDAAIARTDLDGTVEFATDGQTMTVRAWRPADGWRSLNGRRYASDSEESAHGEAEARANPPTLGF